MSKNQWGSIILFGGMLYTLLGFCFALGYDDKARSLRSLAFSIMWPLWLMILAGQKWREFEDAESLVEARRQGREEGEGDG